MLAASDGLKLDLKEVMMDAWVMGIYFQILEF